MKKNVIMIVFGLTIAILFVLLQFVFVVRQGDVVVVTKLGKPVRAVAEAGLYYRWPWPVQRIYRYDNRIRDLEGSFEEALTQDGKNILIGTYAGWRISDPIKFLERVGVIEQAESNLDGLLRTYKNAIIGQYRFSNLININKEELQLDRIEEQLAASAKSDALERYGIDLVFVGINKLGLPEAITQSVFERMRAERQELAERYRSEGQGEAVKIRAQADSERDKMLSKAEADAKRIHAQGDAEAAEYYEVFEKDPELAMFLRKLEVLEETLKEKSTVVLSADTEPFDLLRGTKKLNEKTTDK